MRIEEIQNLDDILTFMDQISYGWIDINQYLHINDMKNFRRLYRTMGIELTIKKGLGTCIEQVNLMKHLCDQINVPSKMFCCRIYEPDEYNQIDSEEHMHCFLLAYQNGKVYQIEHPNIPQRGIYQYDNEQQSLDSIISYYVERTGGIPRPTDEFFDVPENISFQEFNKYINHINEKKSKKKKMV